MAKAYTHKEAFWNESNKDYLYSLYIENNLSAAEIAKITNSTIDQVRGGLIKFNLHKTKDAFKECMRRISSNEEFLTQREIRHFEKYGVKYPQSLDEVKNKKRLNVMEKYGVDNVMKLNINKEKAKNTRIKKYGKYVSEEQENKRKKTCLEKYQVENPFQEKNFHKKAWKHYLYDNITFDSSWELAFYIWAKDHNKKIFREPLRLNYIDINNKKHFYTPDFLYEDVLIEIKGPHFLSKDGNLINCRTKQPLKDLQECMENNNVKLLLKDDMLPILDYIKNTYGKDYLKSFKLKE